MASACSAGTFTSACRCLALHGGLTPDLRRSTGPGSKHHLIVDRHGTALVVSLTSGNRHDVTQLTPLLDAVPASEESVARPRSQPRRLFADRGYDYDKYRRLLPTRGITPKIAAKHRPRFRTGQDPLGRRATFAWLHQFKRLRIRYEIRADLHLPLRGARQCISVLFATLSDGTFYEPESQPSPSPHGYPKHSYTRHHVLGEEHTGTPVPSTRHWGGSHANSEGG
ncbi:transposase [Streptomyces sp. NPDC005529]|uniref:transposase n=1 Tax=unclassified Streptomyces TaxID=2593676 RepID=UPI0033A68822